MNKKKSKGGTGALKLFTYGASLAGLAAAAYFFTGSKGKKNQAQVKSWAIKMKGDVIARLEQARAINQPAYHKIIDTVAAKYEKELKSSPKEIQALAQDLKKYWKTIDQAAGPVKATATKRAGKKKINSKI